VSTGDPTGPRSYRHRSTFRRAEPLSGARCQTPTRPALSHASLLKNAQEKSEVGGRSLALRVSAADAAIDQRCQKHCLGASLSAAARMT
jgi:hypothetical protein